jgi:hypothetical protein
MTTGRDTAQPPYAAKDWRLGLTIAVVVGVPMILLGVTVLPFITRALPPGIPFQPILLILLLGITVYRIQSARRD